MSTTIQNCTLTGVKFDVAVTEAIVAVAEAFRVNAEGLTELAKTINPGGFEAGPLVVIGASPGMAATEAAAERIIRRVWPDKTADSAAAEEEECDG